MRLKLKLSWACKITAAAAAGALHRLTCPAAVVHMISSCCSADGKGVAWDLPKVAQGSRFNGGALGENLRPMEVDNFYSW
jgi:hypothetical protein